MCIQSGPIKLNSPDYLEWLQDQISSCIATKWSDSFYPCTGLHYMYDQDPIISVKWKLCRRKCQGFLWVHYGKFEARYVGGAAWHILEFFVTRNINTARPLLRNLKSEQKCNLGENKLVEMNLSKYCKRTIQCYIFVFAFSIHFMVWDDTPNSKIMADNKTW